MRDPGKRLQDFDPIDLDGCGVRQSRYGIFDGPQRWRRARSAGRLLQETLRDRPSANPLGGWVVRQTGRTPSGREWQGAQSRQGSAELVSPGPALGKMQGEATCGAGEPSGQGEEASPEGLGGCHQLAQTDAGGPAGQIVGDDPVSSTGQALDGQPGGVGREASRW